MGGRQSQGLHKMRRLKLEEGKMTVEAAMIFPIVLFVLVLILYFFFYTYEAGLAAGVLREEMAKVSDQTREESYKKSKTEKELKNNIEESMAKRSVFAADRKITISIKNGRIYGKLSQQVAIPILGSIKIGGFSFFQIEEEAVMQMRMPAKQLRRWQQLE